MRSPERFFLAALFFACCAAGESAAAQQVVVGGVVNSATTGQSLPYATVTVLNGVERFTGADGSFSLALLPGNYRFRIKQLGYTPMDTVVTVKSGVDLHALSFALRPLPTRLAAVRTFANTCKASDNPEDLHDILEELGINAERDKLLRNQYPFLYYLERTSRRYYNVGGSTADVKVDTSGFRSTVLGDYAPGALIQPVDSARPKGQQQMRIPDLTDLANPAFTANHCFRYAGIERLGDIPAYRIDFEPGSDLEGADVEGSAYLDSATYMIRKAVFRLTKPDKLRPSIFGLEVSTTYRELFAGLPIFEKIESSEPLTRNSQVNQKQTQKLIAVQFYGRTPDDLTFDSTTVATAAAVTAPPVAATSTATLARDSTATLAGVVVDSAGRGLSGADVRVTDGTGHAITGDSGQFVIRGLQPGKRSVVVHMVAYGPANFSTAVVAGRTHRVRIVLDHVPVTLKTVVVQDSLSDPLLAETGFYERMQHGWGTFITPEQIERRNPGRASDMLRMINGVDIRPAGRGGSQTVPYSTRSISFSGRCLMNVYIDGNRVYISNRVPLEDMISGSEVGAMEVYPSANETPPQYIGGSNDCGALVIWTKGWISKADSTKR